MHNPCGVDVSAAVADEEDEENSRWFDGDASAEDEMEEEWMTEGEVAVVGEVD